MGKITITEKDLLEAAKEAARIIFHGMHPSGVGRRDEPPECRGFKKEMAQIIEREIRQRSMITWEFILPTEEEHDSKHD